MSESVWCDCHGDVKMGEMRDGKLVTSRKSHGRPHVKIYETVDNGNAVLVKSVVTTK